jgi:hypothetical protein
MKRFGLASSTPGSGLPAVDGPMVAPPLISPRSGMRKDSRAGIFPRLAAGPS